MFKVSPPRFRIRRPHTQTGQKKTDSSRKPTLLRRGLEHVLQRDVHRPLGAALHHPVEPLLPLLRSAALEMKGALGAGRLHAPDGAVDHPGIDAAGEAHQLSTLCRK